MAKAVVIAVIIDGMGSIRHDSNIIPWSEVSMYATGIQANFGVLIKGDL